MPKKKNSKKTNVRKAPATPTSITDTQPKLNSINTEVIAAALSSANQPVLLKVCRLCEAKQGPFLNIFDADKITAKKIRVVMPFGIEENDDLPHKICFRCSAKIEELYEFIQKCIKTQQNLRKAINNKGNNTKTKHRELWEEKLNKSNISNDDICDALIKKAMEGIKDFSRTSTPIIEENSPITKNLTKKPPIIMNKDGQNEINGKNPSSDIKRNDESVIALKDETVVLKDETIAKKEEVPDKKCTRVSSEKKIDNIEDKCTKQVEPSNKETIKLNKKVKSDTKLDVDPIIKEIIKGFKINQSFQKNHFSLEDKSITESKVEKSEPEVKPFYIMDHVSIIKVNGVGELFQCKLCNRNFLKKEVVLSHACAKHGSVKVPGPKNFVAPEPPKVAQTVKFITTKVINEFNKPVVLSDRIKPLENKKPVSISEPINLDDDDDDDKPLAPKKPKPRVGPASRVKHVTVNKTSIAHERPSSDSSKPSPVAVTQGAVSLNIAPNFSSDITVPSVKFPNIPSLNSRYKLMPGPNNTFTLVEEKTAEGDGKTPEIVANTEPPIRAVTKKIGPKSKVAPKTYSSSVKSQQKPVVLSENPSVESKASADRPYPVGLIKSISASNPSLPADPEPGTVSASTVKKNSYTVVQTGNPSKLLISTKPQPPPAEEEVPKKRQRKTRQMVVGDVPKKQPFSVTIEDAAPPADPGFFTFINVDPLLQPSYVLPTDNIIQESQISTSTNVSKQSEKEDKDNKYTCNMCNEKFSREKKLLAHIHSHYNKMDEEDQVRAERTPKKRVRK